MLLGIILASLLVGAVWLLFLSPLSASGKPRPTRAQRQAFDNAEQFIKKGYLAMSMGNADDGQWQFGQALAQARISQDAFQLSEALEGLARARMKKGDGKSAVPLLEEALSLEPQWYTPKPNYSALMRTELEEAKAIAAKQTD
ncbi:MAG: hypothetical protein K2Y39_04795 [Candidatus Obscuribacterales bacterium]|nr:hypothetical protein [Candidatus Obscuribacterales bacterium]